MTKEQLNELNQAFNSFCLREYEQEAETITEDTKVIYIAYTTSENGRECQVTYDLEKQCYCNYLEGELVEIPRQNIALDDFIDDLNNADFDSVVSDLLWYVSELEEKQEG